MRRAALSFPTQMHTAFQLRHCVRASYPSPPRCTRHSNCVIVLEPLKIDDNTVVKVNIHFDTSLVDVKTMKPVYEVSWGVSSVATNGGLLDPMTYQPATGTGKPVVTDGEKQALSASKFAGQMILNP